MKSPPTKGSRHLAQRRACLALAALPILAAPSDVFAQAFIDHVRQHHLEAMKLNGEGVVMDFPRLADTGSAVPLQVTIKAPAG